MPNYDDHELYADSAQARALDRRQRDQHTSQPTSIVPWPQYDHKAAEARRLADKLAQRQRISEAITKMERFFGITPPSTPDAV